MKKIITFVLGAFILFSDARAESNLFAYSRPAPEREFYYQDGTAYKFSDFKGKFIIALFWSKTCVPCVRELKSLNEFYNKTKNNGIQLILISPKGEWENNYEQRQFLDKYKAKDLDFYVDEKGNLGADFGIFSYPHSVLINQEGEEIGRIRGQIDWDSSKIEKYVYKLRDGDYDVKK